MPAGTGNSKGNSGDQERKEDSAGKASIFLRIGHLSHHERCGNVDSEAPLIASHGKEGCSWKLQEGDPCYKRGESEPNRVCVPVLCGGQNW